MKSDICKNCTVECETPCAAFYELHSVYKRLRTETKTELIKHLREQLSISDAEVADDLKALAESIILKMSDLTFIFDLGIKVGYVRNYQRKQDKGKSVNADCRKVNKVYGAYIPFDFIITFYEQNIFYMSENQKKILMYHELRHIGIGERGYTVENHDVEDFSDILQRYGIGWNWMDKEVPDILAGGDGG